MNFHGKDIKIFTGSSNVKELQAALEFRLVRANVLSFLTVK